MIARYFPKLLLTLLAFGTLQCEVLRKQYASSSKIVGPVPCDISYSVYHKGSYYLHRDFVNAEGRLDQKKWWLHASRPENAPLRGKTGTAIIIVSAYFYFCNSFG